MKKLRDYFKLFHKPTSNKYEKVEDTASSVRKTAGTNKYMPHQGKAERARRARQARIQVEKMSKS